VIFRIPFFSHYHVCTFNYSAPFCQFSYRKPEPGALKIDLVEIGKCGGALAGSIGVNAHGFEYYDPGSNIDDPFIIRTLSLDAIAQSNKEKCHSEIIFTVEYSKRIFTVTIFEG
jgi:hypothetical protein